jgi:hypothetical protein
MDFINDGMTTVEDEGNNLFATTQLNEPLETIMKKITLSLAASVLALGLAAPAFAQSSDSDNRIADYGLSKGVIVESFGSTNAAADVLVTKSGKRFSTGDYVDESVEERNQRSSN